MFVWTSGFQKSHAHTDFNMFVDEWRSANESPCINQLTDKMSTWLIQLGKWGGGGGGGVKQKDFLQR